MAYYVDPNQQQQNQPAQNQPPATSSAPGAGPTGSKTPTGSPSQQAPAQPFTNLQAYLTANAPQVQQQANTISGQLTNQYGQVQNDINSGVNSFNQQVAAGYTPENQQVVQQAAANPSQFVQTPENVQAFKSQINDQYTGPANFEGTAGYAPLNAEVTNAAANAALVNTPAGLQTYLRNLETNPTAGETLLDSVLLGQSPEAIQQITKAAAPFSQLPQYLSSATTAADQAAMAAPGAAQKAAADAMAALTGTEGTLQSNINSQVSSDQAAVNAYNKAVQDVLNSVQNPYSQIQSFIGQTGANLTNPFSSYQGLSPWSQAPGAANVATPEQYAEEAALTQLGLQTPFLSQSTVSQAGTFTPPGSNPSVDIKGAVDNWITQPGGLADYLDQLASQQPQPSPSMPTNSQAFKDAMANWQAKENDANALAQYLISIDPSLGG